MSAIADHRGGERAKRFESRVGQRPTVAERRDVFRRQADELADPAVRRHAVGACVGVAHRQMHDLELLWRQ